MASLSYALALVTAAGLATASPASARTAGGETCQANAFATCAAVVVHASADRATVVMSGGNHTSATALITFPRGTGMREAILGGGGPARSGGIQTVCDPVTDPTCICDPADPTCVITPIPEPLTLTLLATGLAGVGGAGLLKRRRKDVA